MRSVLITGASSGIGAATLALLREQGFAAWGASRRPIPGDSRHLAMDARDEAQARAGVARVIAEAGRLDALVLCAGLGIFGSVEEVELARAREQFETNVFGTLVPLRAALPHLRASRGRAVIVGSLAGRAPIPFQAHYSASKAALDALCLALRMEVAPLGVQVSLVEPGDIRTPFNDAMDWGERTDSPYGERLRACEAMIRASLPKAPGPELVARTIHRALSARRSRVRYTVGPDSWGVPLGRRFLPDWLVLRLIRSHFGV